ncbi:MAG: hypothetical protein WCP60_07795 [bacterium]
MMLNLTDFTSRTPSGLLHAETESCAEAQGKLRKTGCASDDRGRLAPALCASAVLRVGEYTWRFAGLSKCLGASLGGLYLGGSYAQKAVVVAVIKIL